MATVFSVLYPGQRPRLAGAELTGQVERALTVMDAFLGDANLALSLFEQQMHVDRFARRATPAEGRQNLAAAKVIEDRRLGALAPAPPTPEDLARVREQIRDDVAVERMQGRAGMGILPDAVMYRRANMYARAFLFAADGIVRSLRVLGTADGLPAELRRRLKSDRRALEAQLAADGSAPGIDEVTGPAIDALVGRDVYLCVLGDGSRGCIAVNATTLGGLRDGLQRVIDEFEWDGPRHRSWWTS